MAAGSIMTRAEKAVEYRSKFNDQRWDRIFRHNHPRFILNPEHVVRSHWSELMNYMKRYRYRRKNI